jgi:hypothetical protein
MADKAKFLRELAPIEARNGNTDRHIDGDGRVRRFDTRGKSTAGVKGGKLAARIGISQLTLADVLSDSPQPMAKTMVKLRAFLDAEAKRSVGSND